jgi:hypothetical protein
MRTKDLQASNEKRSYYRLLRYLVSDEFEVEDQARSLELTDILNLENHEPSKIH